MTLKRAREHDEAPIEGLEDAERKIYPSKRAFTSPDELASPVDTQADVDPENSHDISTKIQPPHEPTREEIFKYLRLRRIVRENHGSTINQCAFFPSIPSGAEQQATNVLATVGGAQANFYDNEHCGDHLDIMSHFVINGRGYMKDAEDKPTEELLTCCWVRMDQDAVLAVAGTDNILHILSLTRSTEFLQLTGHTDHVIDLHSHPTDPNLLLSVSSDGTVRLWHLGAKRCLCVYLVKAISAAFHPNGMSFVTSNAKGVIVDWEIPEDILDLSTADAMTAPLEHINEGQQISWGNKLHGNNHIDCIQYVGDKILSKSINGKVTFWDPSSEEIIHSFNIPGSNGSNYCRFDVSSCNDYFCVGNNSGTVFIYSLVSGQLVATLDHVRSTKAIRCCAFSLDCRNVVYVGDDSLIWRFDYISEETLRQWNDDDPE